MNRSKVKLFFFNSRKHYITRTDYGHIVIDGVETGYFGFDKSGE
jgi:hypothetical protein